ncbi:MAG: hypothetical protein AAB417_00970 [Patescibacteria group bacterium]
MDWADLYPIYVPGFIFGIVMAMPFLLYKRRFNARSIILWIIGSGGAYMIAYCSVILLYFAEIPLSLIMFFIAGCVGAMFMLTAFSYCLVKIRPIPFLLLTTLGGVLALSFLTDIHILFLKSVFSEYGVLYIVWQTGMASAIGWTICPSENAQVKNG